MSFNVFGGDLMCWKNGQSEHYYQLDNRYKQLFNKTFISAKITNIVMLYQYYISKVN